MDTSDAIIALSKLRQKKSQGGVTFELNVDSFKVERGKIIAIVGESGCGKSTLLDIITLISKPQSCELFLLNKHANGQPAEETNILKLWQEENDKALSALRREQLGYILQNGGLLPFLNVAENISLSCKLNGVKNGKNSYLQELTDAAGIGGFLNKKTQFLSGGQRQRVAIVRAMAHQPQCVVADEPTASVDQARARTIISTMNKLVKEKGVAIVMATHDRELVEGISNAIYEFKLEQVSQTHIRSRCFKRD